METHTLPDQTSIITSARPVPGKPAARFNEPMPAGQLSSLTNLAANTEAKLSMHVWLDPVFV